MSEAQIKNRELIDRYPFLLPRNRWTGKPVADYDYSFTELDNMPTGWRKAFGEQMCDELLEKLQQEGKLETYRILQIKEKYGALRWYSTGGTDETHWIAERYEKLSARTCIRCGTPATEISVHWVSPYCDTCAIEVKYESFIPIDVWFAQCEDNDDKEDES